MLWNWQIPQWPKFTYDPAIITPKEKQFLLAVGNASAYLKELHPDEHKKFAVEILSSEGLESSLIEGEVLDRESLQSSIKKHFGIHTNQRPKNKEAGMAEILCNVYETFKSPLSDATLFQWHTTLFSNQTHIDDIGKYRTHSEPMQIVSHRSNDPKIFFEAPPSKNVPIEMAKFIHWYNSTLSTESVLGRCSIAHVYFESIHPFEDGNGRIGRVLVEKALSQGVNAPVLIPVSMILQKRKKEYYNALERCNRTLEIDAWVDFFSDVILQAQRDALSLLLFLIKKSKLMAELRNTINPRQEKVLLRIFAEGIEGFKGGLSAENYIAITKASRATATRDLNELVGLGALTKTGELRHTRYWLKH